jgi:hypothetical protein
MDVDGVVYRIDANADVVSRIDINDLLDCVDLENILAHIDWDRQLSRVDFNSILLKNDINDQSTSTGVFTTVLDLIRIHIVQVDLGIHIHHMTRFNFIRQQHEGVDFVLRLVLVSLFLFQCLHCW